MTLICVAKITQAGGVAAPVGGQVFSEVLPYLEVEQANKEEIDVVEQVQAPDVIGKTIKESEKIFKEVGLEVQIENDTEGLDKDNTLVKEQIPNAGITVNKGSKVYLKY